MSNGRPGGWSGGRGGSGRALRGLLYGIAPADPVSFGLVTLLLLVTAIVACYLPARRAAGLDPTIALRHE